MDTREEEFLKRLKATFKIEADEHVQTISSGLLDLEHTSNPEEKNRILEIIYREAHSLKGAARAVSLRDVEKICQAMETVLSLLKKEELQPSSQVLETLLDSVEIVAKLISTDEVFPIGELVQRLSNITSEPAAFADRSSLLQERSASIVSNDKQPKPDDSAAHELSVQPHPTPEALTSTTSRNVRGVGAGQEQPVPEPPLEVQSSSMVQTKPQRIEETTGLSGLTSGQPSASMGPNETSDANRSRPIRSVPFMRRP